MKTVIFRGCIPLRIRVFPNIPAQRCGVHTSTNQFLTRSEGALYGCAPPCPTIRFCVHRRQRAPPADHEAMAGEDQQKRKKGELGPWTRKIRSKNLSTA